LLQIAVRAKVKDFRISSSFDGYFFVTCRNIWIREMKNKTNEVTFETYSAPVYEEHDIANSAVEQEKWDLFEEKTRSLSENCQKLLSMFFKKISYKQIVKELDYATENVVKQRIFKCKAKLREAIQSDSRFIDLTV
ncbi:MAG: sigma-70 family RNA polymerase sigma factor, partial [Cyclobacteriaceae bacterium]